MEKIIELVNKYHRIELRGVFEYGIHINGEKDVLSKHRLVRIEKVFTKYRFYVANHWSDYLTKEQLADKFDAMITCKIDKAKSYK